MAKQQQQITEQDDLFNLPTDVTASYLNDRKKGEDGLFRPSLDQAVDKKTYYATLRILPNLRKDGTLGATAIEKHLHYAKFPNNADIQGYYDCQKNFKDEKCSLCDMYWALHNSKNPVEQGKKELIQRSTKYYCYVLVIEDENNKENEGKILIFPFGQKIKEMIAAQKNHPKKSCDVEDLSAGKDFNFVMKKLNDRINYDSSSFDAVSPIKINGKPLPLDANGKIEAKYREKVKSFLMEREKELEDYLPKKWSDDDRTKVNKILNVISGNYVEESITETKTAKAADVFSDIDEMENNTESKDSTENFFTDTVKNASEAVINSNDNEQSDDFFDF